jgi:hypothetical protein
MVEVLYVVRDFWHRVAFRLIAMKAAPLSCVCVLFFYFRRWCVT